MKYIAQLALYDYEGTYYRYLPFEGTEQELQNFSNKIVEACEWYKAEHNKLIQNYNNPSPFEKDTHLPDEEDTFFELELEFLENIDNLKCAIVDGQFINFEYLLEGRHNHDEVVSNFKYPEFLTYDKFIEKLTEHNDYELDHLKTYATNIKEF